MVDSSVNVIGDTLVTQVSDTGQDGCVSASEMPCHFVYTTMCDANYVTVVCNCNDAFMVLQLREIYIHKGSTCLGSWTDLRQCLPELPAFLFMFVTS